MMLMLTLPDLALRPFCGVDGCVRTSVGRGDDGDSSGFEFDRE
jgi:hypothetical protein